MDTTQIFYIAESKFNAQFVTKLCKEFSINCYIVDSIEDLSYLVPDLSPKAIVVHQTVDLNLVKETMKDISFDGVIVLLGESDDSFYKNRLSIDVDANHFPSQILEIIKNG